MLHSIAAKEVDSNQSKGIILISHKAYFQISSCHRSRTYMLHLELQKKQFSLSPISIKLKKWLFIELMKTCESNCIVRQVFFMSH